MTDRQTDRHIRTGRHLASTRLTTTNMSTATTSFCRGWRGVLCCGVVLCGVVWCGVVWCGVVFCGVVWCIVAVSPFRYPAFLVRTELKEIQRKGCFPICGP